jgi:hypothetical protein
MIKIVRVVESHLSNNRSDEYDDYILTHVSNVNKAWNEILYPVLLTDSDLTVEDLGRISRIISNHDASKYTREEYPAYLEYFYPSDGTDRDFDNVPKDVDDDFNVAWLHHQKNNPHHWQYWVLIKDSGQIIPMDMSFDAIMEMLCDWHSFSYLYPESTAYNWYNSNKQNMILSKHTKDIIMKYIKYFDAYK